MAPKYQRVLLKLSGQFLAGKDGSTLCPAKAFDLAREIQEVKTLGVKLAIVIGGGNIIRGRMAQDMGIDRVTADQMGMLSTIINALALQNVFEKYHLETRVQTSYPISQVAEPFILRRALRHLEKDRILIFAGGTGNPFFTTDTAATLRASEIRADILLKGTNVDGVYDRDPNQYPDAKKYAVIDYLEALSKDLQVMDQTAFAMCKDNGLPIIVFNVSQRGNIRKAILGNKVGTYIGRLS